ncbi:hypothetical protein BJY01DRAFT_250857 [Aspergillus pseudoustus]|uniref:Hydrophobic surface binding protein A-domain-containing protein n=1 Tax=Aspergillus pseudoustus TaxID=1810923 RepID=A0ABR4JI48_9EURO
MKFKATLLTCALIIPTTLAWSPYLLGPKRVLPDYEAIIDSLTTATNYFSAWIAEYASSIITGADLYAHTAELTDAYTGGSGSVIQLVALGPSDALGLVEAVIELRDATGDMVDRLISAKANLVADSLDDEVVVWLGELGGEMEYLRDLIVDKAPSTLRDVVFDIVDSIPEEIRRAEDGFVM